MIGFRTNNYFGQQLLTDWNGFRLLGMRRPQLDRPLERRRRLPERPNQELPGARERDRLVRQRPDPRPDRSLPRDKMRGREPHPRLLRLLRHLGPARTPASTCWAPARPSSPTGRPRRASAGYQRARTSAVPGLPRPAQHPAHAAVPRPTTTSTPSTTSGSSSRSATPPTETSSRNTTSGSSTRRHGPGDRSATCIRQKDNWAWTSGPRPTSRTGTPTPSGFPGSTTTAWAIRS